MNWLNTIILLAATVLAVFSEATITFLRELTGSQIHFLPSLVVFAALKSGITNILIVAVVGGLSFDSLSANPLGVSVLPLLALGILIHARRDLILQDEVFAQAVLGSAASALWAVATVILLLTLGREPLLGWGSLWQLLVITSAGALICPVIFEVFGWAQRTFGYGRIHETSFRTDREIRRGR